jgi:phosphoglycolate phosphatase
MSASRPFDLIVFDLDGTLADTALDIAHALNVTLVEAGLPSHPIETVVSYVGDGAARLIERAVPRDRPELDLAALLGRFVVHYEARPCVDSRLYPGIAELLAGLAAAGLQTAVLTNKPGPLARRVVETLLPAHRFQAVIGDADGFPRKPDSAGARTLIERCATTADRTAIVGDGIPDVQLARALPARVVAAAWGYSTRARLSAERPTWIADTPRDVRKLLLPDVTAGG